MNILKLRGRIVEKAMTIATTADQIGMDRSTFYRKLSENGDGFTLDEVHKLIDVLGLTQTDAIDIFLPMFSQK